MSRVFISYRRDDCADAAGRIDDRLAQTFSRENVFKDVDSIPLGVDFRTVIKEAVGRCQVLLAVIGPGWLSIPRPSGGRRLDDPGDFVRLEIEAALQRDIPVVPVLVGGATMPPSDQLPEALQGLAFRNGIELRRDPDFHRDVERLLRSLTQLLRTPTQPPLPTPVQEQQAYERLERKKAALEGETMALFSCTDCGRKISDKAPACPNCGCPVASSTATAAAPSDSQARRSIIPPNRNELNDALMSHGHEVEELMLIFQDVDNDDLASLTGFPNLARLHILLGESITDRELLTIGKISSLRELKITCMGLEAGKRITSAGIRALTRLKYLELLDLECVPHTALQQSYLKCADGLRYLQQENPSCVIARFLG